MHPVHHLVPFRHVARAVATVGDRLGVGHVLFPSHMMAMLVVPVVHVMLVMNHYRPGTIGALPQSRTAH